MLHQSLAAKALAHPPLELSVRRRASRLFFHSAQVYQPRTDLIRLGRMGRVGGSAPWSCPVSNLRSLCSYCLISSQSDNNLVDFRLWRFAVFSPLLFSVWRLPSQVAEAAALPVPGRRRYACRHLNHYDLACRHLFVGPAAPIAAHSAHPDRQVAQLQ